MSKSTKKEGFKLQGTRQSALNIALHQALKIHITQCSWALNVCQGEGVRRLDTEENQTKGDRIHKIEIIIEDMINNRHKIALGGYHHKVGEIFHNIDHNLYLSMKCI